MSAIPWTRLPFIVAIWLVCFAVKFLVLVPGLVMVAFMYRYRNTPYYDVPAIFLLWQNPEDWCDGVRFELGHGDFTDSIPPWWKTRMKGSGFWAFYKYHAIRNPADGLRNLSFYTVRIDPSRVKYATNEYMAFYEPWANTMRLGRWHWFFAWQGFAAQFKLTRLWNEERYFILKIGHKIEPNYAVNGISPTSVTSFLGAPVASKFLPYREIS